MSLNVTQSNNNLTLQVSQSNVKATLSVTQNINELHITAIQNNEITKLQPIVNTNSSDFIETDPIFQASEASLFVAGDKANLDNQSGVNTGDETTSSIQTKRPLKTVNGESLEGSGNVQIDYNDLDNLPTLITNHSQLNLDDGTNPHGTTKNDVGLSNVDNTSDIDKPISTATQQALDLKQNLLTNPITGTGTTNRISKFTASGNIGDSQIFDNGTNVGIGTDNPLDLLHIPLVLNKSLLLGHTTDLDTKYTMIRSTQRNSTAEPEGFGVIGTVAPGAYNQVIIGGGIANYNSANILSFVTGETTSTRTGTERIRITSTGNVGIGTITPQARLDVKAQGATSTDIVFRVRNSTDTTNLFQITGVGNVLLANNNFIGFRNAANNGDVPVIQFTNTNQLNLGTNSSSLPSTIGLWTNSTERVRILNNGNVNIGSFTNVESALLVLNSTSKGFLPPRMTTVEKDAIISPAAGLIVYDTTDNKHYGFNGTTWNALY